MTTNAAPVLPLPDSLPTEAEVLAHGFDFRPQWWQAPRTPPGWADFLTNLPEAAQGRQYHRITRRDLLTHRPDGDGSLLLACYVWGTGDGAFLAPRRARVFRDTDPDVLTQRLTEARRTLSADGPVAAFTALNDGGPLRTKHMRASFFTKFLYAADSPGDSSCGRALILDQFVAIALNDLNGWHLPEQGGWTPDTYGRWLSLAADLAADESERRGQPVRPDAVEMAYFVHGRRLANARRAPKKPASAPPSDGQDSYPT